MSRSAIRVLLLEDSPTEARIIEEMLRKEGGDLFEILRCELLADAIKILEARKADLALLDMFVPDSQGLETLERARHHGFDIPIIILTSRDDSSLAIETIRAGAQDYLVKGQVDGAQLVRSVRYAIERNNKQMTMTDLLLTDELTGLFNSQGLQTLAAREMALARRSKQKGIVLSVDIDDLRQINETHGPKQGDAAIKEMANLLRNCFRGSDILGRLEADEFASFHLGASEQTVQTLVSRLREEAESRNAAPDRKYKLSFSLGLAVYDPERPASLEDLLSVARSQRESSSSRLSSGAPDTTSA